jgi:hypothetical protein
VIAAVTGAVGGFAAVAAATGGRDAADLVRLSGVELLDVKFRGVAELAAGGPAVIVAIAGIHIIHLRDGMSRSRFPKLLTRSERLSKHG